MGRRPAERRVGRGEVGGVPRPPGRRRGTERAAEWDWIGRIARIGQIGKTDQTNPSKFRVRVLAGQGPRFARPCR